MAGYETNRTMHSFSVSLENTMTTRTFTGLVQLPVTQFEHSIPCDMHKTKAFSLMLDSSALNVVRVAIDNW